ncbi:phosphatase PAP2 family protein [Bacillus sp. FJAT-42376]|uniref:phosphatase PAP2 family protein n=1 Tax=Bacillus sp. FJAT-42376 TaxID=2014076 RepID=UPI000F4FC342|nr:phosphatase PAP2 family protein [Bacillus sp. FJAT-42376]AZB43639.1 phosphatase PAP2 family protein [Bacillus sp. FJAT-42376]
MIGEKMQQYLSKAFLLSLVFAVLFGLTAYFVHKDLVISFDQHVISFVQTFESPPVTDIMKFLSWAGSGTIVFILAVLSLLIFRKILMHRSEVLLYVTVVLGSAMLNQILKLLFHRPRPDFHRLSSAQGFSFPSGHSMEAVAFYGILAFILWKHLKSRRGKNLLVLFSILMIAGIGLSRIYLGVHYPSDVLGGYLCSICWLTLSIWHYQQGKDRAIKQRQRHSDFSRFNGN